MMFYGTPNFSRFTMSRLLIVCFLCVLLFTASACSSVHGKFEQSISDYNDFIRWHKLENASQFASDSISDQYIRRMLAAKNMKVFDYHIVRTKYNESKSEAEVTVEFQYYTFYTNTLKTLLDVQKWAYVTENGSKQWKLMSLLPEFR